LRSTRMIELPSGVSTTDASPSRLLKASYVSLRSIVSLQLAGE
jgi:hypothetical protein